MDALKTKDHAEAVAVFRSEVVGSLCRRELPHGDLVAALRALASERFRLPGADVTKTIPVPTLERWYYAYRKGGLAALRPKPRSDRGRARALAAETRELLLAIRRENPSASVPLILGTLVHDGRLDRDAVSPATVRRLYADHGLDRVAIRDGSSTHTRLRWQAERPGALWHGDVCHGPNLLIGGQSVPLRIHGMLDDNSRFVVALEAMHSERELFASDAVAMIHEAAGGGMRDADRLASAALREAARKKRKLVERDAVARVIDAHTNGDTGA